MTKLKVPTDQDFYDVAQAVTPGASQTRSKQPGRVGPRDRRPGFPLFAVSGDGPYLITRDGTRYLDFAGANAAVPLGYTHRGVQASVMEAVREGPLLSLPYEYEAALAAVLSSIIPCAQQARFVKTGSEACTGALLLAQAHTGAREVWVEKNAYHGWHEWAAQRPAWVREYELNDRRVIEAAQFRYMAAVFFEPPRFAEVNIAWLQELRQVCTNKGIPLVFDEMVMGFRLRLAGGSEFYNVKPDLACYGKALANGYPLACIVGRRDIMAHASQVVSGTFGGDRIGIAAAAATLDAYQRDNIIDRLWQNGLTFWQTYSTATREGVPKLEGHPVHFRVAWHSPQQADDVLTRCAEQGVLFHRDACNSSAAMTEDEVRLGAQVLASALNEVV